MVYEKNNLEAFKQNFKGQVLQPGEPGYTGAKEIWNGAIDHLPALIFMPESVEDIQGALDYARGNDLPVSILSGGHDWAGRALNKGGMVISLRKLKRIIVDEGNLEAVVQGGVTAGELIEALDSKNLVAVTGTVGGVGLAGLTLGGGYGPLSPSYGLAIDNLLGAEMILADGRLITVNARENEDIFWAIRGGGGNFGIIVSMRIKVHKPETIIGGLMLFAWPEAEAVLKGYGDFMLGAPDELSMLAGVIPGPDGSPLLFLAPTWNGDLTSGEKKMEEIKRLGNPFFVQVAPMRYKDLLALFDAHIVNGRHCFLQTRWLTELNEEVSAAVIDAASHRTSVLSLINFHHFHGASTRIDLKDTAFGVRNAHFMLEIIAVWEPEEQGNAALHQKWAKDLSQVVARHSIPGGYANLLGPEDSEQIPYAHGENLSRLREIKRKTDPGHIFKGIPLHL
jgi:hypothetical protein